MKTIVVVSDTHGNFSAIEKLLPIINENDYLFHLGDHDSDVKAFSKNIKSNLCFVKGNCDGGGEDEIVTVDGVKILLTHGDRYGVKSSLYKLLIRAKELGVKAVFYGHTHRAEIIEEDGIFLINPGSMTFYGNNTYCYAVVSNGKITASIVPIDRI